MRQETTDTIRIAIVIAWMLVMAALSQLEPN